MSDVSVVVAPDDGSTEDEILEYWSGKRIRDADPLPLPVLPGSPPNYKLKEDEPRVEAPVDIEPTGLFSFRTEKVSKIDSSPYKTCGKLYMAFGNQHFVGSAWVIRNRGVFTAGHCLYDPASKQWASKILFRPQYNRGRAAGSFALRSDRIAVLQGWIDGKYEYDLAVSVSSGEVGKLTGLSGLAVNLPSNSGPFNQTGYPAAKTTGYDFDGEEMWHCIGSYQGGASIIKADGNMTGGCSGGPWFVTTSGVIVPNGLNSHRYTNEPNNIYSPYFGAGVTTLVRWLEQNGGL